MKIEEFFAKYEEDGEMAEQLIAASKDENTLYEFLKSHGVEVASASGGKEELSDDELSKVAGGGYSTPACLRACGLLDDGPVKAACKAACVFAP